MKTKQHNVALTRDADSLKQTIRESITQLFALKAQQKQFIPGKTWLQYSGGIFDDKEINSMMEVLIEGWFGLGKKSEEFEKGLASFLGVKGSIITNSGSSSNLLIVSSLMSKLFPDRLYPGDEVITAACGFPTTVNPLLQNGLVPVFLDIEPDTYNINPNDLEKALSPKTKAVMITHTLGNPNDLDPIIDFCRTHKLHLIEDNCDALGSEYNGKKTGSFGILSSQSFYPPHHMTMGEGGAVNYNDLRFDRITRSFRDWGRSCWCRGDEKRTWGACGARFNYRIAGKPYDHKYIFSHIGYNLKPTEPQAAMGVEQLKRLPYFTNSRKKNFKRMMGHLKSLEKFFILPKSVAKAQPSWFSFPLTIRDHAKFDRKTITMFLEERMIQTRTLFGGNLARQPAYAQSNFRVVDSLEHSDRVLFNTFFVGVYPGLGNAEIDYIAESIHDFCKQY